MVNQHNDAWQSIHVIQFSIIHVTRFEFVTKFPTFTHIIFSLHYNIKIKDAKDKLSQSRLTFQLINQNLLASTLFPTYSLLL